jgi:hypothetical protein
MSLFWLQQTQALTEKKQICCTMPVGLLQAIEGAIEATDKIRVI